MHLTLNTIRLNNLFNHIFTKSMNRLPLIIFIQTHTKTTTTLFTPDIVEYDTTLSLNLKNQTLPTTKHPKILGITLDPKLTFSQHVNITITKAKKC